jgi:hypothetical protein
MPSARVTTLRWGCTSAWARVRRPSRTRPSTKEWSSLIWVSRPLVWRYTRESPTLTTEQRSGPVAASAHRVVPMPVRSWRSLARRCTAELAVWTASRSESTLGWSVAARTNDSTASAEATSPPRCPPMPSATATTWSATANESSFRLRTCPTSVAAAMTRRITGPRSRCRRVGSGRRCRGGPSRRWPRRSRTCRSWSRGLRASTARRGARCVRGCPTGSCR